MFLTRCPNCFTTFRITSEQMSVREGKVRCGSCHQIFNALTHLKTDAPPQKTVPSTPDHSPFPVIILPDEAPPVALDFPQVAQEHVLPEEQLPLPNVEPAPAPHVVTAAEILARRQKIRQEETATHEAHREHSPEGRIEPSLLSEKPPPHPPEPEKPPVSSPPDAQTVHHQTGKTPHAAPHTPAVPSPPAPHKDPIDVALEAQKQLPPEAVRQQGLEAGLVTARDMNELPGYSRWSSPSLLGGLEPNAPSYPLWPFLLASAALSLILAVQAGYYYRAELSRNMPTFALFFKRFDIQIPLSRNPEWISIEDSDLQPATKPGQWQMMALLYNGAAHGQAWPYLEVTLTDAFNAPLTRKVFLPEEYLPPPLPAVFAHGETPVHLLLETGELPVAGYNLNIFYPPENH